jgi:hypothetical protein
MKFKKIIKEPKNWLQFFFLNLKFLYSLDLFQIYTNVSIIHLKHYYKSTFKNFNISLKS